jgi:hypothetical protein
MAPSVVAISARPVIRIQRGNFSPRSRPFLYHRVARTHDIDHLLYARAQMGFSLAFHMIFAAAGVALPRDIVPRPLYSFWIFKGGRAFRSWGKRG